MPEDHIYGLWPMEFIFYDSSMPKLERMPEDHIYMAYGVYLLHAQHRFVRRLKRVYEPSVHGHKTWKASFILMDYLQYYPPEEGARVMEIGCGWGPAAIYCAKRFKTRTTGVDIDKEVFPYLDVLAALNDVKVEPLNKSFQQLTIKRLSEEEVLIGADVCFWDNMVKPLTQLVARAFRGGVERVVIADPGRPTFYEFVDLCAKRWKTELNEWYAVEPSRTSGEILIITN